MNTIEARDRLEEILYKNQNMESLLSCLQIMLESENVEVLGIPEDALVNSLFEVSAGIGANNRKIEALLKEGNKERT